MSLHLENFNVYLKSECLGIGIRTISPGLLWASHSIGHYISTILTVDGEKSFSMFFIYDKIIRYATTIFDYGNDGKI